MGLTTHQKEILEQSIDILTTSNRLLITGSAGVGKTYLVNELITQLSARNIISEFKSIMCSAPTNKAVAVLKGKVTFDVFFSTIHSALKLKQSISKDGEISFKPYFNDRYPPLENVGLLVVDEASMINSEVLGYIEHFAKKFSVKVIFIGDQKQLNPVGEDVSPVFVAKYPQLELTEIIRQGAGNPIIDLSRNLQWVKEGKDGFVEESKTGFIYSNDKDYILEKLVQANGTDDLKYLAWTNGEVDAVNNAVRKKLYGNPRKIEQGETIIFNSPFKDRFFTNEELKVHTVDVDNFSIKTITKNYSLLTNFIAESQDFKCYVINSEKIGGQFWPNDAIIVLHEDSEKQFRIIKSMLLSACKNKELDWVIYYNFLANFADFKYNHALTVHKSQGSTYKQAVINVKNLFLNYKKEERERLLYTAVTRASDLLVLYNA